MQEIGHWINGKMVAGTSGRFADVFNPATGEVQARVALASKAELDAATAAAAEAQVKWGATNPQRRARVMMAMVGLLNRDMDKLAEALSREEKRHALALDAAVACKGVPTVILADTIKGKGVSFMEGKSAWHGKAIPDAEFAQAMQELGGNV